MGDGEKSESFWKSIKKYKFESVVLTLVNLMCMLFVFFFQDSLRLVVLSYLIGVFGAITVVSATYLGLKDFEELPKKVYTPVSLIMYLSIGGILAAILQSLQPVSYSPIQAFTIGATWPAVVQGLITPMKAKAITTGQEKDADEFLISLGE